MQSGRNASVEIGQYDVSWSWTVVAGMSNWEYSGESREVIEAPETFDADYVERLPGVLKGGDIEISGVLKPDDSGLDMLNDVFDGGNPLVDSESTPSDTAYGLKLKVSDSVYYTVDASTDPDSVAYISKKPNAVTHEASGVAQVSFTISVSGQLKKVTV